MIKLSTSTPLHDNIQETVDGARIMQGGVRLKDPEMVTIGWQRIRKVKSGSFVKKLLNSFNKAEESQVSSGENKG